MTTDDLKTLIRTEPTVANTFASVDSDFQAAQAHADALGKRHAELRQQLDAIADAKAQLAAPPIAETGEPAPDTTPAAKPTRSKRK